MRAVDLVEEAKKRGSTHSQKRGGREGLPYTVSRERLSWRRRKKGEERSITKIGERERSCVLSVLSGKEEGGDDCFFLFIAPAD